MAGSKNILQRPIRKLFPLEFADENNETNLKLSDGQISSLENKINTNMVPKVLESKCENNVVPKFVENQYDVNMVPNHNNKYVNDGNSLKTQVSLQNNNNLNGPSWPCVWIFLE